jgi:hypothetical protein
MPDKPSPPASRYRAPCPDPQKGTRCRLCGGTWVCLQLDRPKKPKPAEPGAALAQAGHTGDVK